MSRRKKPQEPHVFSFFETLPDYFSDEGAARNGGSKDYTRQMHLRASDYDRVQREATLDDLVTAVNAAPVEVRIEFDRKLRNRLTETRPAKAGKANARPPSDISEHCKQIARLDDESLRRFVAMGEELASRDNFPLTLIGTLAEEVLRMRRDLQAAGRGWKT